MYDKMFCFLIIFANERLGRKMNLATNNAKMK